ncbi:transcriptional regulator [Streptomyces mirabilis]|uniref:transcriptional regulator n=1 Tax=Streptomyces mirabilis TaxID=68239 RepID=UPI003687E51F
MASHPRTLRDHRLARQLTRERLAHRIGIEPHAYAKAETENRWNGDEQQTRALAAVLGMLPDDLREVIGKGGELIRLLKQAVDGRWKRHVTAVADFTGAEEAHVQYALRLLNQEYQQFTEHYVGHVVARSGEVRLREIAAERARWLRRLPERFRELVSRAEGR